MNHRPRQLLRRRSVVWCVAIPAALVWASAAPAAIAFAQPAGPAVVVSSASAAPASPPTAPGLPTAGPALFAGAPAPVPATLSITGNGAVELAPDVATIAIEVRSTGLTATSARSKANARTNAVLAAITRLGIDRGSIQTSGISLSRSQVAATRGHPAHKVYSASDSLTVRTTKVSLVGPLVDAATQAGADSIDGPNFSFGDPSAGRAAATRAALADARSRADDAAAAIGYRIVGVASVAIDPVAPQFPLSAGAAAPAAAQLRAPLPTPVAPGQQEVDSTVDVVFVIAPIGG